MSRKRTGLRNKFRRGRSTYSASGKSRSADTYGQYERGKQTTQDIIGGHVLVWHRPHATATPPKEVPRRVRRTV